MPHADNIPGSYDVVAACRSKLPGPSLSRHVLTWMFWLSILSLPPFRPIMSQGPKRKDVLVRYTIPSSAWDEHRREATLDALVTAGSCGQMSVAGLLPYLRMDGGWTTPSGARGTSPCLAMAAAAVLTIDSFMPKYKHGTARHGNAWAERHASVLRCWAEETPAWPQVGRHHQVSARKQGDTV
ncbi:hypothetical protein V8C44DRAFT_13066 [Trichoderma aethiopicum]